ncbi:response regulator transcription factor [Hydrogenimonas sp.]
MKPKILLLEDDMELSDTVAVFLRRHRFEVTQSFDADDAREKIYESRFDILLLDVKVPRQSGIDLLAELREEGVETPAIFITSLHGVEDATRGFDVGADDYIRKPFALKELLARIEAVRKRHYRSNRNLLKIDEKHAFDVDDFTLYREGARVPLKPKEAKLLALFLEYRGKTLSKERIFDRLWEYDETPSEGSLRTMVRTLRRELGKDLIETVKDVGYRFLSRT